MAMGVLLGNGDSHYREVVEAACNELPLLKLPVVPAKATREPASALSRKKEGNETTEATRTPLTAGLEQNVPAKTTIDSKALAQTRTLARASSARIAIKSKRRILFVDVADVIAVEAKGNYVLLIGASSSHILRESISTIEQKLKLHGFVRIHRSVLVNAALVEEIHPRPTGEYVLCVRGGKEFTVTRTYKTNLRLLAQLWIGTEGFASE